MLRRNFKNKQQETDGKKNHYNKNKKIDEKKRQKTCQVNISHVGKAEVSTWALQPEFFYS